MADPLKIETLKEKFEALQPLMSERLRRHWAATEAKALGQGGIAAVIHATGLSRNTITRGMAELADTPKLSLPSPTRSRRPGGGCRPVIETDPIVIQALETLVEPTTRGDPMSPVALDMQEHSETGRGPPEARASCRCPDCGASVTCLGL
jgi:hypothetical protein